MLATLALLRRAPAAVAVRERSPVVQAPTAARREIAVRAVAAHPGYSATNLQDRPEQGWQRPVLQLLNRLPFVAQPAEQGALPVLYAATVPDLPGGIYIGPDGPFEASGYPRPVGSSAASHDREKARGLWTLCEELTGEPFTVR